MAGLGQKRPYEGEGTGERPDKRLRPEDVSTAQRPPMQGPRYNPPAINPHATPMTGPSSSYAPSRSNNNQQTPSHQAHISNPILPSEFDVAPPSAQQSAPGPVASGSKGPVDHTHTPQGNNNFWESSRSPFPTSIYRAHQHQGQQTSKPQQNFTPPVPGPAQQQQQQQQQIAEWASRDKQSRPFPISPITGRQQLEPKKIYRVASISRELFGPASFFHNTADDEYVLVESVGPDASLAKQLELQVQRDGHSFVETNSEYFGGLRQCGLVALHISWGAICRENHWSPPSPDQMFDILEGQAYWSKVAARDPDRSSGIDWNAKENFSIEQLSVIAEVLGDGKSLTASVELCQRVDRLSMFHRVRLLGRSDAHIKVRLHHNGASGDSAHWSGFARIRQGTGSNTAAARNSVPSTAFHRYHRGNGSPGSLQPASVPSDAELEAWKKRLLGVWDQAFIRHEEIRIEVLNQYGARKVPEADLLLEDALSRDARMLRLRDELNKAHCSFKCIKNMPRQSLKYAHLLLELVGIEPRAGGKLHRHANKTCAQVLNMPPNTFTKLVSSVVKTITGGKMTSDEVRKHKYERKRNAVRGVGEDGSLLVPSNARHPPLEPDNGENPVFAESARDVGEDLDVQVRRMPATGSADLSNFTHHQSNQNLSSNSGYDQVFEYVYGQNAAVNWTQDFTSEQPLNQTPSAGEFIDQQARVNQNPRGDMVDDQGHDANVADLQADDSFKDGEALAQGSEEQVRDLEFEFILSQCLAGDDFNAPFPNGVENQPALADEHQFLAMPNPVLDAQFDENSAPDDGTAL